MKALSIELKIILFTLAAHLFYSNSELLIAAKELATPDAPVSIFDKSVLTAFALSYSVMTTVAVFTLRRLFPVLVFAVLDGFAVYLRINVEQPQFVLISSLFYGFYTAYIIVIAFTLKAARPAQVVSAAIISGESSAPAATLSTSAPAPAQPVEPAAIIGGESPASTPSASPSKPAPRRARSKKQLPPQPVPVSAPAHPPAAETTRAAPAEVPSDTRTPFTQLTLF